MVFELRQRSITAELGRAL